MANTITYFKKYTDKLDEVYRQSAKTVMLEAPPQLVQMSKNANEFMIPKMDVDGLGDYDRSAGYAQGGASIEFETKKCDYDRGRKFNVDAMDNEETAGLLFGRLSSTLVREKATPELDAYRFAKYAAAAGIKKSAALSSGTDVLSALIDATNAMDEAEVDTEGRILFIRPTLDTLARNVDTTKSKAIFERFSQVVHVPKPRFFTAISLRDGKKDDELAGGYVPAVGAFPIDFMIIQKSAVIQFTKHLVNKVISPEANQSSDGYLCFYRAYGIAEIFDNKKNGIYLHYGTEAVAAPEV